MMRLGFTRQELHRKAVPRTVRTTPLSGVPATLVATVHIYLSMEMARPLLFEII